MIRPTNTLTLAIATVLAAGMSIPSDANASDATLISKFSISFLGINVAKMTQGVTISDSGYKVSGGIRANSLVSMVANTKATFASAGTFSGSRAIPSGFNVKYKSRKKSGNTRLNYSAGNVTSVSATPAIKYKPGTVPVESGHLKSVIDPLSALLFPVAASDVGNGNKICNRRMPMFDGKARFNLVFSYKGKSIQKAKGFKGEVFTCAVRYQPISGIRPAKKNIKFMKANRDMQVSMARVGNSNVYTLFGFNVRTDKGTASGKAYSFVSQ